MGLQGPIIGRGHAQFFVGRKEIVVFHLGLGDFKIFMNVFISQVDEKTLHMPTLCLY